MIKGLLVLFQRLPRRPSIRADPTIVPSSLVVFLLLQDEVVQLNHICILLSELVRGTVYTDNEVPTIHGVNARHFKLSINSIGFCMGVR